MPAAIVGAAETAYLYPPEGSALPLLAEAARSALADAGLRPRDVDGLAVASFSLAPDHAIDVAWRLGLHLRWLMEDTNGGASGLNMLQHALRAVEAGDARAVLLLAGDALGLEAFRELTETYNSATRDHLAPIPTGGPNALFALLTRRHMEAYDLERRIYGELVVAQRRWAERNPNAVFREPLSLDEYLAAAPVAEPLTRYDCVPIVSGADAIVVAEGTGVAVAAIRALHNHDDQDGDGLQTGLAEIAPGLWSDAQLAPEDVDIVSIYDDYPVMVLVQLADLGLIPDGDVARFVTGRIAAGAYPLNTSGGQLSAGQAGAAGGLHGLVEVVRQLRGEAGPRQVEGARSAIVTGYGMVLYRYGACANAAVLTGTP